MNVSNINSFLSHTRFSQLINLNISTTWSLFNLVTAHVVLLQSLLLVHQVGPLWKSPIALFGMLHLVSGMNFPRNYACLVTHTLPHLHLLLHMAVHHHHLLHYHHYLSLLQSFIPNLRLGFLANPFHHRPFPYLSHWLHGLPDHFRLYFAQRLDLFT